ncbi:unannotated protein [freshwater metagenome]|uniref:Unannotated protein n=1 Tax=freshwater metagenome TaxID=449393 RepID=A0A6J7SQY8_9ZZZZ
MRSAQVAGIQTNAATMTKINENTAEMKKPRLMADIPERSPLRGATAKMPITAVITPIAGTTSGNTKPSSPKAALPRINAATSVTAYDSKRSAAMPAQSPTLSPTLSAIVAALRGSSSGMPCSTFPTRSAPTSAALVKIPPPTRMNIARSAAPKPKPSSTFGASPLYTRTTSAAPNRPKPTVNMPATPPVRKAIRIASCSPESLAAAATRTLPRTASHIPI